jgi:hypothetical protein
MDVVGLIERLPRRRRVVVPVAVLLIAAGCGGVGWYVLRQTATGRALAEAVAAIERDDPRWRLADLDAARATVPDADNGALVVLKAASRFPTSAVSLPSTQLWSPLRELPPDARLTDTQFTILLTDVRKVDQEAITAIQSLADYRAGRYPYAVSLDYTTNRPPQWDAAWQVEQQVLWPLTYVHIHKGDIAAAVRDCRCLLSLARTFGDEPSEWSQGYRASYRDEALRLLERVLAHGEASAAELTALQAELIREGEYDTWAAAVRFARAMAHELFLQAEQGQLPFGALLERMNSAYLPHSGFDDFYHPGLLGLSLTGLLRRDHTALLRATTRMLEIARLPPHERAAALRGVSKPGEMIGPPLTRIAVNRLMAHFDREQATQARLRSVMAALAAERYRLAHARWPDSLPAVVPEFLPSVPDDPYDGRPLRYCRTAEGVVIYSVGPDGTDDGGRLVRHESNIAGVDIGCQLWDVNHRRQPPPPPETPP